MALEVEITVADVQDMNPASTRGVPDVAPRPRLLSAITSAIARGDLLIVGGAGFGKRALVRGWAAAQQDYELAWHEPAGALPAEDWSGVLIATDECPQVVHALGEIRRAWKLLVVSPREPKLDLSIAKLNGALTTISSDQLRMTTQETAELLPNASPAAIARIQEHTGGWPIIVQALAHRLADVEDIPSVLDKTFRSLSSAIFDFCESNILHFAEADERHRLTCLAPMVEIDVPLSELLTGVEEGAAALDTGLKYGLVRRVPEQGARWQTCHPVLASHLQSLEYRRDPKSVLRLHDKAAVYFEALGEEERAIYHARYAENWSHLASLLVSAGGWRLAIDLRNRQSNRDWLYNCVEDLPERLVADSPALRLARAMLRFCCGEIQPAMRDYGKLDDLKTSVDETLSLEISVVGLLMRMLDERPPSDSRREEIEANLRKIPSADIMGIALMENALSIAAAQRGEMEDALEAGDRARRLYSRLGEDIPVSVVGLVQGRACSAAGLRNLALRYFQSSQKAFEKNLGFNSDLARCSRILIGKEELAGNEIDKARANVDDALEWVETQEPQFHAAAFVTSICLAVLDEGLDAGANIVDTCIRFAQRRGLDRLERLAQICWLEQLCGAGEAPSAGQLAEQVKLDDLTENRDDRLLAQAATMCMAEIEIGCEDIPAAQARLNRFRQSDRWLDTVSARVHWHALFGISASLSDTEDAGLESISEAVRMAVPEGLSRVFASRGNNIYPVLRAYQKARQQNGQFANRAEDEFLTDILSSIRRERRINRLAVEGGHLTPKEEEIVELLCKGLSNKEIARILGTSDNTVKWHLKNLFQRFDVTSRSDLAVAYQISVSKRADHNLNVSLASFKAH